MGKPTGNGAAPHEESTAADETGAARDPAAGQFDPEVAEKIAAVRAKVYETFGKVALAMMALPRYRHQSVADLNHILLEPLMRERVAIASAAKKEGVAVEPLTGIAFWASVSEEVDAKIREQIKAGVFPVRLKPEDWASGSINWLLDVIAPNQRLATAVIANFRQVVKEGDMRIHPIVTRLVDPEALKKMGAAPIAKPEKVPETAS